jgi:hypothetical protein
MRGTSLLAAIAALAASATSFAGPVGPLLKAPRKPTGSTLWASGTYRNPQRNAKRKLVERMGIRQFKIQRRAFKAAQGAI